VINSLKAPPLNSYSWIPCFDQFQEILSGLLADVEKKRCGAQRDELIDTCLESDFNHSVFRIVVVSDLPDLESKLYGKLGKKGEFGAR